MVHLCISPKDLWFEKKNLFPLKKKKNKKQKQQHDKSIHSKSARLLRFIHCCTSHVRNQYLGSDDENLLTYTIYLTLACKLN